MFDSVRMNMPNHHVGNQAPKTQQLAHVHDIRSERAREMKARHLRADHFATQQLSSVHAVSSTGTIQSRAVRLPAERINPSASLLNTQGRKPPAVPSDQAKTAQMKHLWRVAQIASTEIRKAKTAEQIALIKHRLTHRTPTHKLLRHQAGVITSKAPQFPHPQKWTLTTHTENDPHYLLKDISIKEVHGVFEILGAKVRAAKSEPEMKAVYQQMRAAAKSAANPGLHHAFRIAFERAGVGTDDAIQTTQLRRHLAAQVRDTAAKQRSGIFNAPRYNALMKELLRIIADPDGYRV